MAGRYELSDDCWHMIKDIVSPPQVMGRPRRDDLQMLNGIFWIPCSGAKWRGLPERYGPWKAVYQRFRQWRDDGTLERILSRLPLKLREDSYMDRDTYMADSTSIRATRSAAGGGKRRFSGTIRPCLGRRRGSLTTKIHLVCDTHGVPLSFLLSPGQHADLRYLVAVMEQIRSPDHTGRPRKRCRHLLADRGYDSDRLRRYCDRYRIRPTIRHRQMYRHPKPGLPRLFERPRYRGRNVIERLFGWMEEKRRLCTRYDKLAKSYRAMVTLACIERCLRICFSGRT